MKFIFSLALLIALSGMLIAPVVVFGQAPSVEDIPEEFRIGGTTTGDDLPKTGAKLIERIQLIANWVFAFFLAISLIYIVLGAFQFVTAGGNPEQVSAARQKLIFAVIGIAIGLLVFGIPVIIRNIVV